MRRDLRGQRHRAIVVVPVARGRGGGGRLEPLEVVLGALLGLGAVVVVGGGLVGRVRARAGLADEVGDASAEAAVVRVVWKRELKDHVKKYESLLCLRSRKSDLLMCID